MSASISFTPSDIRTYFSARVPGLQQNTHGEWRAPCPIHKGERDSFAVHTETGQWFCHSECGKGGDIIALEMELSGSEFGEAADAVREIIGQAPAKVERRGRPRKNGGRIVATYDYTDESGALLFQVVRMEPKDFRQRKPKAVGNGWDWTVKGVRLVPFRLPELLASDYTIIPEGERDVLTLESLDVVATCNPMGAGKWREEFNQHFAGKRVFILPDSDTPGRRHAAHVAEQLLPMAASVKVVEMPEGFKDVTDWVAAGATREDLTRACQSVEPITAETLAELRTRWGCDIAAVPTRQKPTADSGEQPLAGEWPEDEEPEDASDGRRPRVPKANAAAERILQREQFLCDDSLAIYRYTGTHWSETSVWAIRKIALEEDGPARSTERRRSEIVGYIRAKCHRANIAWRDLHQAEVPFVNGVLDVCTGKMRPHRPEDLLESVLPHRYGDTAECPIWLNALQTYWGADADCAAKIAALQEFFGYVLLPHARYKRALVCQGESDTGKSQIAYVLRKLVGNTNCSSVSVEDMDDSRKRTPLIGKMLNVLTELTSRAIIADGGFKTLVSTEEPLQFDEKFKKPILYTPTAKHVIVCNDLPQVNDRSMGTYNRLIMLRFSRVIPLSEQDRDFQSRMEAEILGIARWAAEGARRLVEHGGMFTRIAESEHLVTEYRESQNDIFAFVSECCETHPFDFAEPLTAVWKRFTTWSQTTRHARAATERMLRSAGFRTEKRMNVATGKDEQVVVGLRLIGGQGSL